MKNKEASKAINLFHGIDKPNEVILVLVLNACAQLQTNEALDLVKRISSNLSPSHQSHRHLMTSLLDALMKCGDVKSAESIFTEMKKKPLEMYGAMMKGKAHFSDFLLTDTRSSSLQGMWRTAMRQKPLNCSTKSRIPMLWFWYLFLMPVLSWRRMKHFVWSRKSPRICPNLTKQILILALPCWMHWSNAVT